MLATGAICDQDSYCDLENSGDREGKDSTTRHRK